MADLRAEGGVVTQQDLASYTVRWAEPVTVRLDSLGLQFYSVPPPGSGPILAAILNILDQVSLADCATVELLTSRFR